MEDWRKRTFPVGIKEGSLHGELADYPLIVYYPAVEEGLNANPDEKHAPYPGLVFAHGYMATAKSYVQIGKILGSHGYVAAFFSASMGKSTIGFGRFLRKIFNQIYSGELSEGLPLGIMRPMKAIAQNREAIVKTTDYLSSNPLNIVRTDKIGIVGHSLGGMTSLQAAAQDDRLKALVACSAVNISMIIQEKLGGIGEKISKKMIGDSKFAAGIKIPTQFIHGTKDTLTPFEHGLSYYNMIKDTPKEALVINDKLGFKDRFNLKAHILGLAMLDKLGDEYTPIVMKYMVNWFNFFLYNDQQSWTYIFGKKIKKDLSEKLLSQLKMKGLSQKFHSL